MPANLPTIRGKELTTQLTSAAASPFKHLPMLLTVQLVANPFLSMALLRALATTFPAALPLVGPADGAIFVSLAAPIYWAFLAGGTSHFLLALARHQPNRLSMIFGHRSLFRKYVGAGVVAYFWAILTSVIATVLIRKLMELQSVFAPYALPVSYSLLLGFAAWLLVKCSFIDLAIADKNLGSIEAIKYSKHLSDGSLLYILLAYLFFYMPVLIMIRLLAGHDSFTFAGWLVISVWLAIVNFWRVQLYCSLTRDRELAQPDTGDPQALAPGSEPRAPGP